MPVHVSLHDVSPAWEREVEHALELCAEVGAKPALLVVPNFHGASPLLDHPAFCARLRELQTAGHEVYLHGFFHLATGEARGASGWFRQKIVSAGEAEFSAVTREEAAARLDDGARVLAQAGLRIDGFVAPAWSMPRWVNDLLADRGYRFTEDHTRVIDPAAHRARPSVVLNYASRTPGRLLSSVAWCRLAKIGRVALPARVAIHPADMRYALLRGEVASLLAWAATDLVPRGRDLLAS